MLYVFFVLFLLAWDIPRFASPPAIYVFFLLPLRFRELRFPRGCITAAGSRRSNSRKSSTFVFYCLPWVALIFSDACHHFCWIGFCVSLLGDDPDLFRAFPVCVSTSFLRTLIVFRFFLGVVMVAVVVDGCDGWLDMELFLVSSKLDI